VLINTSGVYYHRSGVTPLSHQNLSRLTQASDHKSFIASLYVLSLFSEQGVAMETMTMAKFG
jgi:hypothetical protein